MILSDLFRGIETPLEVDIGSRPQKRMRKRLPCVKTDGTDIL